MEFFKTSGTNYIIDKNIGNELVNKYKKILTYNDQIDISVYYNTLKEILTHEISLEAYKQLRDDIIKLGFITVTVPTELFTLECSVGVHDNKLVYGVLDPF